MVFTRRQSRMAKENSPAPQTELPSTNTTEAQSSKIPSVTLTPKSRGPMAFLSSITHRAPKTPKQKSPIKPDGIEMHPHHHQKTATPYEEARWLGFFKMGSQPEPAKAVAHVMAATNSPTPVKTLAPNLNKLTAPNFKFTFSRDAPSNLSPEAQALIAETEAEVEKVRAEMLAAMPSVPDTNLDGAVGRKIARPKGKAGRFSDVHMAEFKKMDSIANHASAWRSDPSRVKSTTPATTLLKRSPSKAELDAPVPASFKRSSSQAELDQSADISFLRMPSKSTFNKPTMASLKRSPSKVNLDVMGGSTPTKVIGHASALQLQSALPIASPSKRIKRDMRDDVSATRPVSQDGSNPPTTPKGPSLVRSKSGLLKPGFSNLMTPTRASLARTQSVKNLRGDASSMLLSLARSKSTRDLTQPHTPPQPISNVGSVAPTPTPAKTFNFTHDSPVKPPVLPSSPLQMIQTPARVKSILRTPNRRYTRDPSKIAAGTHLSTPPQHVSVMRTIPATAPVRKHVNFTASTKEMEDSAHEALKAASAEPELVQYPVLFSPDSPRRTTLSDLRMPGAFTFRSDREVTFPATVGTIRQVRSSDVGVPTLSFTAVGPTSSKRKLDNLSEVSEDSSKENRDEDEGDRPAKKARTGSMSVQPTPRKDLKKSKLPTRKSGLSAARLHMLATPKRRT